MQEEIADLDEQIAEKARAPLSRKRQSNERLTQAKETFQFFKAQNLEQIEQLCNVAGYKLVSTAGGKLHVKVESED